MSEESTDAMPGKKAGAWSTFFRRGLSRTLVAWFLLLALVPLGLVSGISYQQAKKSLRDSAFESLAASAALKTAFIDNWFSYRLLDLEVQATSLGNRRFLEDLERAFEASGKEAGEYVGSYQWASIVDAGAADLRSFRRTYGYYDVFLIDSTGNILFSVTGESDLGTNLFAGSYSGTFFSEACKRSLRTGRPVFSDFEAYAPSGRAVAGFLVSPMIDDDGEKIGLVAFQMSRDKIDAVMQDRTGLGETGESYLVGEDGRMRSSLGRASEDGRDDTLLLETEQVRRWREGHTVDEAAAHERMHEEGFIYIGPNGKRVLGIHHNVQIADVSWALIAEIEEEEAFSAADRLRQIVVSLGIATGMAVLLLSVSIARRIVRPLLVLSETTRSVAAGHYDQTIAVDARNEIGDLAGSFRDMLVVLRDAKRANEAADWLKTGQTGLGDAMRGDQDLSALGRNIITFLAKYSEAQIGAFYVLHDKAVLRLVGSYAYTLRENLSNEYRLGEGMVGQAALEKESIVLSDVPEGYIKVQSGVGALPPATILVMPVLDDGEVRAVVELGAFRIFGERELHFLRSVAESIGIAISTAQARVRVNELLEESQRQAEELKVREEELLGAKAFSDAMMASLPGIFYVFDERGKFLRWNSNYERVSGYSGDEIAHMSPEEFFPEGERARINGEMLKVFSEGWTSLETDFLSKDGSVTPHLLTGARFEAGGTTSLVGVGMDITERVRAEERLRDSNAELQTQSEELQAREEELRESNETLEAQAKTLRSSEERLQTQQEELRQTNEELEEQRERIERQNVELQEAQAELEERAQKLELTSRYKSEFLANMSHELRTPLNSLLILSQVLEANKEDNLSEKQLESIRTIHSGGQDLLRLINDILDLSKVEAGMVDFIIESVSIRDLAEALGYQLKDISLQRGLDFTVEVDAGLPVTMRTDHQRVSQVLKNLLANAFKFTERGTVALRVFRPGAEVSFCRPELYGASTVAFAVSDTGVGIAKAKKALIFDAFKQADGGTSRTYGGTGLGLSISREFAEALGGEIQVESQEGQGSTFTLFLPESPREAVADEAPGGTAARAARPVPREKKVPESSAPATEPSPAKDAPAGGGPDEVRDDRREIQPGGKSLLIIEDDASFAQVLADLAREKGFKCVIAEEGAVGLRHADYYKPSAIILDIGLPGMDGWTVMSRLKENPATRHIPVHFMSAMDEPRDALEMGAVGYLMKPLDLGQLEKAFSTIDGTIGKPIKDLLVAAGDEVAVRDIAETIGNGDVKCATVASGEEACVLLKTGRFDCVVIHPPLSDMSGADLLNKIQGDPAIERLPVVVYSDEELSAADEAAIAQHSEHMTVHAVRSPERLLDETVLFLHRVEANLPESQHAMLRMVHDKQSILNGKKIILADDDMRNVFALSAALEDKGMEIVVAKNGKEALLRLEEHPETDLVLMDIMMPEMDGYQAMEEIRRRAGFEKLPIIALTAKAMKGDRQKCISAGASDYLSKPVDLDKLASLLRVWLYR